MSQDESSYLPLEQALQVVGAIQEEEHIHQTNRRIFTVYDRHNREICWFDAEETIAAVSPDKSNPKKKEIQPKVEEYILNHIPAWVLE